VRVGAAGLLFGRTKAIFNGFIGDYGAIPKDQLSERVKEKLNEETQQIFKQCAQDVEELLTREKKVWEHCAEQLLKKDELEYDDIVEIFAAHGHTKPGEEKVENVEKDESDYKPKV